LIEGKTVKPTVRDVMRLPRCGAYCGTCIAYQDRCVGCVETEGQPYYSERRNWAVCPVWACAKRKGATHCGLCEEFPSDTYLDCYSRRRDIITVLRRAGLLALRKKMGDEAWTKWLQDHDVTFGT
jgi:hypothetical protein